MKSRRCMYLQWETSFTTLKRLPSGLASEKPRGIPRIDDRRVLPCAPGRAVLQEDQIGGHPTGKSVHGCPALREKIFGFSEDPNHRYIHGVPSHTEGRFAIVTDVGAGCGGREGVFDERRSSGRRSRVVLTPRRRRQVCGRQVGPTGRG